MIVQVLVMTYLSGAGIGVGIGVGVGAGACQGVGDEIPFRSCEHASLSRRGKSSQIATWISGQR